MKHNLIDYLMFGAACFISFSVSVIFTALGEGLGAAEYIAIWASCVGFVVIFLIVLLTKIFTSPDWISAQGIKVFFPKDVKVDNAFKLAFSKAVEVFIREVSNSKNIKRDELLNLLSRLFIKYTSSSISLVGLGWQVKDKAGVQQGNSILVKWQSSIPQTALVHEIIHYVRQTVTGLLPDYKHEDKSWWDLESVINQKISKEIPYA